MKKLTTLAIAGATLGLSYGVSFAQSSETQQALSDDAYLAMANSEAFDMFADEPTPLASQNINKVYILGLGQVASSFYCALDVLDAVAETVGKDQNGILFIEVGDVAAFDGMENCYENDNAIQIANLPSLGS